MRFVLARAIASTMLATSAVAAAAPAIPGSPDGTPTAFVAHITAGLSTPIGIVNAGDGSDRLFIFQQGGALRVAHGTTLNATAMLTLNASTMCRLAPGEALSTVGLSNGSERGLLGVAFHPAFENNGMLFVGFTDANGDTMVARFTMADPDVDVLTATDLDTCTVVLRIDQDGANHNGGNIVFGPDGYLYVGMGDGGGGGANAGSFGSNDGCNRAQTLNPANLASNSNCAIDANFTSTGGNADSRALLGKMLRIDVDRTTTVANQAGMCGQPSTALVAAYAIPDEDAGTAGNQGNPFADGSTVNGCDEVWSLGLRNPWRYTFDRSTNDLFIADVGQGAVEEVDFEAPSDEGNNYGWRCFEGNNAVNGCASPPVQTAPIITYGHSGGRCSITGGYRYRGPVTTVQGQYFYADYCTGEVWASTLTGGTWSPPGTPFVDLSSTTPSFGEDEDGNLYVLNGSQVLRLDGPVGPPPTDPIFSNGFE